MNADPEVLRKAVRVMTESAEYIEAQERKIVELEEKAERYRLTTLRQDARVAELEAEIERWRVATEKLRDGADESARVATEQLARAEQRVAELEAALREAANALESDNESERHAAWNRIRDLNLARAESADLVQEACGGRCGDPLCNLSTEGELMRTPAKHPDTDDRLVESVAHMLAKAHATGWKLHARYVGEPETSEDQWADANAQMFTAEARSAIDAALRAARKEVKS